MIDLETIWNFADPAATEAKFRALLPDAEREGGEAPLELLTQLARTLSLQKRFDEAHLLLDEVVARMTEEMTRIQMFVLLERGRTFNSAGTPELARPLFLEAWQLGEAGGEEGLAVDAGHMLGIVDAGEASIDWNTRSLAIAQRSSDARARRLVGALINNTGWTYHHMERYEDALQWFEIALTLRSAEKHPARIHVAQWCVARCLRSLGRVGKSLAMQRTLKVSCEARGEPDPYVDEEIAACEAALQPHA